MCSEQACDYKQMIKVGKKYLCRGINYKATQYTRNNNSIYLRQTMSLVKYKFAFFVLRLVIQ